MQDSFWRDNNAWWKSAAHRMADGTAKEDDWNDADRRLWCLSRTFPEGEKLSPHDRQDLVQTVFLRLQEPEVLTRLMEVDTPAHYLRSVMRNQLRNDHNRREAAREVIQRHAELVKGSQDQRPDEEVAWNDEQAKARFVVYHLIPRKDREVLCLYYWEGLTPEESGRGSG